MDVKTFPVKNADLVLAIVHGLLILPPIVLNCCLYRLAQRAAVLIGHWPAPMINDPKWIGQNDAVYQHLSDAAYRIDSITFYSFFAWVIIAALVFGLYDRRTRLFQAGLFFVAWGLLWFNPWSLLYWWMD